MKMRYIQTDNVRSISGTSMRPKKNGSTYRMFHLSDFWETATLRIKKRKSEKGNEKISFTSLSLLIQQALFEL